MTLPNIFGTIFHFLHWYFFYTGTITFTQGFQNFIGDNLSADLLRGSSENRVYIWPPPPSMGMSGKYAFQHLPSV